MEHICQYENTIISAPGLRYAMIMDKIEQTAQKNKYMYKATPSCFDCDLIRLLKEQQFILYFEPERVNDPIVEVTQENFLDDRTRTICVAWYYDPEWVKKLV